MKHVVGKMPWDMVVFLTITTAGFGVSVKRLAYPDVNLADNAPRIERGISSIAPSLDLGCLESLTRKMNRSTDGRTVRVKGKLCYSESGRTRYFENISVSNKTTGGESTVFFQNGDRSFVTDSMVLQPGKNVIEVRWKEDPKENERVVVTEFFGR